MLEKRKYGFTDMVGLAWKAAPLYVLIWAITALIGAVIPTAQIFVTSKFFDSAAAVYNGEAELSAVYAPVILLGAFLVWGNLSSVLLNFLNNKRVILIRRKTVPLILKKQAALEYRHIENSETADLINRVAPGFSDKIWEMYINVQNVVSTGIYIVGIFATLFSQVWLISLILIVLSVPLIWIAYKAGKETYAATKEMTKIERRADYISTVLRDRENVEERSVFGYTDAQNDIFIERSEFARKFKQKISIKNRIKQKSWGLVLSLYSVAAMAAMLVPVTRGELDFGMFIALMTAVFALAQRLSWGINGYVEGLAKNSEFLKDLTAFMALPDCEGATDLPKRGMTFDTIEFKNVSFKYPGTDKLILDGVSFIIERGKHYSFVGVNGAGKTTITKLLTGLYETYDGEISVDGRSLRGFTQAELKGLSSVVYQDFAKYFISMYDNVAIADLEDKEFQPDKHSEVLTALGAVGLSSAVAKLKDGADTPLGKIIEGGADLSGGEWQRLAMARSVMSSAPLKILDEPTAALDPVAESNVYTGFEQISKGTTTIFISHRLGSTKLADVIYVIADGRIAEQGSHAELMQHDGVYAKMFLSQAAWYKSEEVSAGA
jgi:ABC-type multidrug transport system fused ATPase/permease subunit